MRYYVIMSFDKPNSLEKRQTYACAYSARITALQEEGRLLTAGPLLAVDTEEISPHGFKGNMVIGLFSSLEAAQSWLNEDPYMHAKLYCQTNIYPFKQIAP